MCVIMCFEDQFPTMDMLQNAEDINPHGGGMSWINKDGDVQWMKGRHMTPKIVMKMIKEGKIQLPIIIHYRIATHGAVNDMLCHPFPLGKKAVNQEQGITKEGVMFHNGVWTDYNEYAIKLCMNRNINIPDGDMSDSSIMAWIASHVGHNFLHFTEEKVITMTPKGITRYGEGWVEVNKVTCSNDYFEPAPSFDFEGDMYQNPHFRHGHYQDNFIVNKAKNIDLEAEQRTLDEVGLDFPRLSQSEFYDDFYEELDAKQFNTKEEQKFYEQHELEELDG
jgi:hypothetical protein